jgi:hypothetical protein
MQGFRSGREITLLLFCLAVRTWKASISWKGSDAGSGFDATQNRVEIVAGVLAYVNMTARAPHPAEVAGIYRRKIDLPRPIQKTLPIANPSPRQAK